MLQIYGSPLSSPSNKVCYVANYLNIPYEFYFINIGAGDQRKPEYLKINKFGKIPAIDDDGFTLGESNAIIQYLSSKHQSSIYPQDIKQRAIVDSWIDYSSLHVMVATSKIMFNTHFYKFADIAKDERSLQDGRQFLEKYLPIVEKQLTDTPFLAGKEITLADIAMIAALDTCEVAHVDLSAYTHLVAWRKKIMNEAFYKKQHENYAASFNKIMSKLTNKVE